MSDTNTSRTVTLKLGIGITVMPYIFSWFTLRKGYSTKARVIAFGWLFVLAGIASSSDFSQYKNQSAAVAGGILKERASRCHVVVYEKKNVEFAGTKIPDSLTISTNEICDMTKSFMEFQDAHAVDSMKNMCPSEADQNVVRNGAKQGNERAIGLARVYDAMCTPAGQKKQIANIREKEEIQIYSLGTVTVGATTCPAILVGTSAQLKKGLSAGYHLYAKGACADAVNAEEVKFDPNGYPGLNVKAHGYSGELPSTYTHLDQTYPYLPPPGAQPAIAVDGGQTGTAGPSANQSASAPEQSTQEASVPAVECSPEDQSGMVDPRTGQMSQRAMNIQLGKVKCR